MTRENKQEELIVRFNTCIQRRDLAGLAALMTSDHAFIDTANHSIRGNKQALEAWNKFFRAFPDYQNTFSSLSFQDDSVTITGYSTCSDERLAGPAIWTAKVRGNLVAEWRVYQDTPANRGLLGIG